MPSHTKSCALARADAVRLPMGSKKRKAASTPSAAAAAPTEEARVAALQAWLLAAGGTIHPSLRFGNDGNGGTGSRSTSNPHRHRSP